VRAFALEILDELVGQGVKMLVIACNSASAAVLRDARERYDVPVVEVIAPAVRRAVNVTRNGRVGVIGTEATITSRAYDDAFAAAPHLTLISQSCPRFVEFVESGVTTGGEVLRVAEEYLAPVREAQVDTLVLGCTHYPMLTGAIQYVVGDGVTLVSSAEETAKDVYRTLVAHDILRDAALPVPHHTFLATGDPEPFADLGRRILGPDLALRPHAFGASSVGAP
jgi:glutamate racemase